MNDVSTAYASGSTLYFIVLDGIGYVWAGSGVGFVEENDADWSMYVQPMTETSTPGTYQGAFPSTIGRGIYVMYGYKQLGASPSPSDLQILLGAMDWDGTEEATNGANCTDQGFSVGTETIDIEIETGITPQGLDISFGTGVR